MKFGFKKTQGLTALLMGSVALGTLAGCTAAPAMRAETAKRIASPAFMVERKIPAGPFLLTAYERAHQRGEPANLYIEGDGLNWLSRTQISLDPTPTNPVALHLAAKDKSRNVFYLARPCQYSKLTEAGKPCDSKYWTSHRYAPEVIDAFDAAIDDIKAQYDITAFNLVGFSGGGAIAAILAARRDDVQSLRTVAGNLDHEAHSSHHDVSYLSGSLNPPDFAPMLGSIPQRHFVGGEDEVVPPLIAHSYTQALDSSACYEITMIQEAEHIDGWVQHWPDLLQMPVKCKESAPEMRFQLPEKAERPDPDKP